MKRLPITSWVAWFSLGCSRLTEADLGYSKVGNMWYCMCDWNYDLSWKDISGYSGDSEFGIQEHQCRKIAGKLWAWNYHRNLVCDLINGI